jgi:hypothetical protein
MNDSPPHRFHGFIQRQLLQLEHDGQLFVRVKQAWGIKDRKLSLQTRLVVLGIGVPYLSDVVHFVRHSLGR